LDNPSFLAIPLGGLGEFGMNMLVLRSGDDMILIDAGMMFPEVDLLGADIVIPDVTCLSGSVDLAFHSGSAVENSVHLRSCKSFRS
jgi:mRNA degradation ribonuclease J1/J2